MIMSDEQFLSDLIDHAGGKLMWKKQYAYRIIKNLAKEKREDSGGVYERIYR